MATSSLAARAVLFVVLLPGTVTVYLPHRILRSSGNVQWPALSIRVALASLVIGAGAAVLLASVWQFFASGRGTLAPIDPPKVLVVSGLYRYTRNPMYNGVVTALLGEAWLFSSGALLGYAVIVFAGVHLFVILYEEHALQARFGEAYRAYRTRVPRWGFTVHPYPESGH